ncbi:uncharacterized protein S100072_02176 [Bacillus velezensis]|nr:uncharacterized protein S100072_02176 [Bacillus velezensis]
MNLPRVSSALAVHTIRIFSKGDMTMGRTKLGNRNAQQNNNAKKKNGFGQKFDSYAGREAEKLMASNKRHGE